MKCDTSPGCVRTRLGMRRQVGPSNQDWRRIFLLGHSFLSGACVYVTQTGGIVYKSNPPSMEVIAAGEELYCKTLRQLCALIGRRIQGRCLVLSKLNVNSPSSLHSRLTPTSRTPRGRPVDIVAMRRPCGLPEDRQVRIRPKQALNILPDHRYPTLTHRPTTLRRSQPSAEHRNEQQQ